MNITTVPTIDERELIPDQVIHELVNLIVDRFKPDKVILFGSYATGTARPESDIDLLIIMKTPIREIQQALEIRQFINPLFGLDILVYTPERTEQRLKLGDSFLRAIIDHGIVLYESVDA